MALFGFKRSRPDRFERDRVEACVREAGGFSEDVVVKINEIVCADPACPGYETVILVMVPGERSVARKIGKPLSEVMRDDVAAAMTGCS